MDISHKYPYTNFEQLNIDFLLESVADHSNKIVQLRTDLTAETAARIAEDTAIRADLQTEINTRIADVEALTAEDEALTAFANAIQADLNQEIADRAAAVAAEAAAREAKDDALTAFANAIQSDLTQEIADRAAADAAVAPVLFHLSYGQGGVLDCLPDEANDIMKAFDENRRAMAYFQSGEWFERISIGRYPTLDRAVFVQINNLEEASFTGKVIVLTHVTTDDTHAFAFHNYELDTEPIVIHASTTDSVPITSSIITTTDNLWNVTNLNKIAYIELTTAGNKSPMIYDRNGSYEVPEGVRSGDYEAYFNFSLWNDATKYVLTIHLEKTDATDPTTWSASIHALRMIFNPA